MSSLDSSILITAEEFAEQMARTLEWVQSVVDGGCTAFVPTLILTCVGEPPAALAASLGEEIFVDERAKAKQNKISDRYQIMCVLAAMEMEGRFKFLERLGRKVADEGVIVSAAYFASEAWISSQLQDAAGKRQYKMPSDDPQRIEAVVVMGMSVTHLVDAGRVVVTRTRKNKMVAGEVVPSLMGVAGAQEIRSPLCERFFAGYARAFLDKSAREMWTR